MSAPTRSFAALPRAGSGKLLIFKNPISSQTYSGSLSGSGSGSRWKGKIDPDSDPDSDPEYVVVAISINCSCTNNHARGVVPRSG
jgi:hypothetical protein